MHRAGNESSRVKYFIWKLLRLAQNVLIQLQDKYIKIQLIKSCIIYEVKYRLMIDRPISGQELNQCNEFGRQVFSPLDQVTVCEYNKYNKPVMLKVLIGSILISYSV